MKIELLANTSTHSGMSLQLSDADIEKLIRDLLSLKSDPRQHFHISTAAIDAKVYVDIEISHQADNASNVWNSGVAIDPTSP